MKETNNKKNYMSPMVEILNARVEKGFVISGEDPTHQHVPGTVPPSTEGQLLGVSAESFD